MDALKINGKICLQRWRYNYLWNNYRLRSFYFLRSWGFFTYCYHHGYQSWSSIFTYRSMWSFIVSGFHSDLKKLLLGNLSYTICGEAIIRYCKLLYKKETIPFVSQSLHGYFNDVRPRTSKPWNQTTDPNLKLVIGRNTPYGHENIMSITDVKPYFINRAIHGITVSRHLINIQLLWNQIIDFICFRLLSCWKNSNLFLHIEEWYLAKYLNNPLRHSRPYNNISVKHFDRIFCKSGVMNVPLVHL